MHLLDVSFLQRASVGVLIQPSRHYRVHFKSLRLLDYNGGKGEKIIRFTFEDSFVSLLYGAANSRNIFRDVRAVQLRHSYIIRNIRFLFFIPIQRTKRMLMECSRYIIFQKRRYILLYIRRRAKKREMLRLVAFKNSSFNPICNAMFYSIVIQGSVTICARCCLKFRELSLEMVGCCSQISYLLSIHFVYYRFGCTAILAHISEEKTPVVVFSFCCSRKTGSAYNSSIHTPVWCNILQQKRP